MTDLYYNIVEKCDLKGVVFMSELKTGDKVKYLKRNKEYYGRIVRLTAKYAVIFNDDSWENTNVSVDKLEMIPPYYLTAEQVKKFIRFEEKWSVITEEADKHADVFFKEPYRMTTDDILTAMRNIKKHEYDSDTIYDEWYKHLYHYFYKYDEYYDGFGFGLEFEDEVIILEETPDDVEMVSFLPDRGDKIAEIIAWLNDIFEYSSDEFYKGLDENISMLENYLEDEEKPIEERHYTDNEKVYFIKSVDNDDRLKKSSKRELEIYRKFVGEMSEKNDITALRCLGYGCYGGNAAYECDWETSLDCMLKLYELTGEPMYANTLGYIYYYGRCWNGEPHYEEAFKYFSIGAAGYYYESRYKLADMYWKGLYVKQNKDIAESILAELYRENIEYIKKGNFDCKFADIALRLGNYYKERYRADSVYECYLQADFAIKRRLQYDYYGDVSVAENIRKELNKLTEKMPKRKKTAMMIYLCDFLNGYLKKYRKLQIKIKPLKNGNAKIIIRIAPFKDEKYPPKMFLTETETGFCGMMESVSFTVKRFSVSGVENIDDLIYFDRIDGEKFYLGDKLTAVIKGEYYFTSPKRETGKKYKFASVYFNDGGKRYDYILGIEGINIGDEVIVMTDRGETVVTVADIAEKSESELALPIGKYKKIIRKNDV